MPEPDLTSAGSGQVTYLPSSTPPAAPSPPSSATPSGWNYPFSPDVVRTIVGEGDPAFVASVLRNRSTNSGLDYDTLVTQPNQFEARTGGAWKANSRLPVTDPKFQAALTAAAPILTGAAPPTGPWDVYYSPAGQKALGRVNPDGTPVVPDFAAQAEAQGQHGVNIGGNVAYVTGWNGGATSSGGLPPGEPNLLDAKRSGTPAAPTPGAPGATPDPAMAKIAADVARGQLQSAAASGKAQWPIYDAANGVGRNADGSIAFIGSPPAAPVRGPDGSLQVNLTRSTNPDAIQAWLAAHPQDPANSPTAYGNSGATTTLEKGAFGVAQGVANGVNSASGLDAAVRSNPFGNAFLTGITGQSVDPAAERAALARGVLDRNSNDVQYGDSVGYGLGKFGGELAATLPLMAVTDGAGGLVDAGVAGSRLAPAADFLAGRTGGNLFMRGASLATRGALQGGEAAALTSAGSSQPLAQQVAQGAGAGAVLGPAVPLVGKGVAAIAALKGKASPEALALADKAINDFDIPIRLGQVLGVDDPAAALKDSQALMKPATGAGANQAIQQAKFTAAALRTAGTDEPDVAAAVSAAGGDPERATPETMGAIRKALGARYNDIAGRTNIVLDPELTADLTRIEKLSGEVGLDTGQANSVAAQIQKIRAAAAQNGGRITGAQYQGITDTGSSLSILQNAYGPLGDMADQIANAVNGALERSASAKDTAMLHQTDGYYKNLMTLAPITDVGKTDPGGFIRPSLLAGRVRSNFANSAFSGAGDLGDLANVATLMRQPADSKTAARWVDYAKGALGAAGLGGEGAALWLHNAPAAIGLAGTAAASAAAKVGGEAVYGARYGANAARAAVARAANPAGNMFMVSPTLKRAASVVNDNLVPAGAIGANRLMQPQGAQ